jgi:hypothetical protein
LAGFIENFSHVNQGNIHVGQIQGFGIGSFIKSNSDRLMALNIEQVAAFIKFQWLFNFMITIPHNKALGLA